MDKAFNSIISDEKSKNKLFDEIIMEQKALNSISLYSSECQIDTEEYNWISTMDDSCLSPYAMNLAASFNDELILDTGNVSCELKEQIVKESIVLLKNDGVLPLSYESVKKITLIGPYADNEVFLKGAATILSALQSAGSKAEIVYAQGCGVDGDNVEKDALLAEAVWAAEQSDVVILAVGRENPRDNSLGIEQEELIESVCGVGKTTILLNFTSSSVDLSKADELCGAILQCWNPNEYVSEIAAKMIFGDCKPTGKLPMTFYSEINSHEECAVGDKRYRYFKGITLYPFGYGLNYSFVEYYRIYLSVPKIAVGEDITVTIFLKNKGHLDTQDVVQAYLTDEQASVKAPKYRLADYKKVMLPKDEEAKVSLTIKSDCMAITNGNGERVVEPGRFSIYVGAGQPDENTANLYRKDCLHIGFLVE